MLVILTEPEPVIFAGVVVIPVPACTSVSVPGALLVTHAVVATLVLLSLALMA